MKESAKEKSKAVSGVSEDPLQLQNIFFNKLAVSQNKILNMHVSNPHSTNSYGQYLIILYPEIHMLHLSIHAATHLPLREKFA